MLSLKDYNKSKDEGKTMKNKIRNTIAGIALATSSLLGYSARADESKNDLESAISAVEALSPRSISEKTYLDRDGIQSQTLVKSDAYTLAFRDEFGVKKYGLDLKLDKIDESLGKYRFNFGQEEVEESKDGQSRLMLERSFDTGLIRYANVELQNHDDGLKNRAVGSLGFRKDKFNFDITMDTASNFGYGAVFNFDENTAIGIGGKRVDDINYFNGAFNYTFTSGILEGNKLKGQIKVADTSPEKTLDARIRFGDKASGGAFLVGTQDTLFNSLATIGGGDGDLTFPFGIGKFDFFGASDHISGKAGTIGLDLKYHVDSFSESATANMAFGLGNVSDSFLKNNKVQIGRFMDLNDSKNNVDSLELRTTLFEGKDNSWSVDLSGRMDHPESGKGENTYSVMLGASIKF